MVQTHQSDSDDRPTVGSLFSGIGGIDLGLERAGFRIAAQVEIDDYCRRVLAKHWPGVPRFADIREVTGDDIGDVDLLAGGFPCQDISNAGKRAGIDGERSGLWGEFARLVREIRPRYVLVENVGALLGRGIDRVLGDLAALGYDAEWESLPAAAFGAPHLRWRVFLVAYPNGDRCNGRAGEWRPGGGYKSSHRPPSLADAGRRGLQRARESGVLAGAAGASEGEGNQWEWLRNAAGSGGASLADAEEHSGALRSAARGRPGGPPGSGAPRADGVGTRLEVFSRERGNPLAEFAASERGRFWRDWWATESGLGRVAHGTTHRVDRLRGLGNAVVPACAELIGGLILRAMRGEE